MVPLPAWGWLGIVSSVWMNLAFAASCANRPFFVAAYRMGSPAASRATNSPVTEPDGSGSLASLTSVPAGDVVETDHLVVWKDHCSLKID